VNQRG